MKLPNHIGIIMDGNGRWAENKNLSRSQGHYAGAKNLKKLAQHIFKKDIKYLSVYAFSNQNFKRSKEEVNYLMDLFIEFFKKELNFVLKEDIKVVFSGRRDKLSKPLIKVIDDLEEKTKDKKTHVFNICLNYGSQIEIVDMVKKIIKQGIDYEEVDEQLILKNLYQDLPELDFIIRTSGELRTSDFMLYQSAYAEYYFPKTYFPDFNEKEFDKAIEEYNKRQRRFGGNNENKSV